MTVSESKEKQQSWPEYIASYWSQQPLQVPDNDALRFCTIEQLRKYSQSLTAAIDTANDKIREINSKVTAAEDKVQQVYRETLAKDAFALEKLQQLSGKVDDVTHSVFTTLADSKQHAASCFATNPLAMSQKISWDHYDTLSGVISELCSQPATEEAIQNIDQHISKLLHLTEQLAMRRLTMCREMCLKVDKESMNFEDQKQLLEASFAKREERFQEIHTSLLKSKDKLSDLCIDPPPTPEIPDEASVQPPTIYNSYLAPVIQMMKTKTYPTGFEHQPSNLFHKLITEYFLAKENAQAGLVLYQQECDEAFKVYKEHELARNERAGYVETKQFIERLIQEKEQFVLVSGND